MDKKTALEFLKDADHEILSPQGSRELAAVFGMPDVPLYSFTTQFGAGQGITSQDLAESIADHLGCVYEKAKGDPTTRLRTACAAIERYLKEQAS